MPDSYPERSRAKPARGHWFCPSRQGRVIGIRVRTRRQTVAQGQTSGESFDYVIVGAGSAGCVLANRLTEDPNARVLLLEAGGEDDADEIHIPAAFGTLFKTRWDWNYETTEQKYLDGKTTYWPRMKAIGGCSSMNAMIYIRGNRLDY